MEMQQTDCFRSFINKMVIGTFAVKLFFGVDVYNKKQKISYIETSLCRFSVFITDNIVFSFLSQVLFSQYLFLQINKLPHLY